MRLKSRAEFDWRAECERLEARLAELEGTLHAISHGEVDAVVVEGPKGVQIFSLRSSEEPYRILAERMNEGAATLTAEGTILYCNPRLAGMVGVPGEKLVGQSLVSLLHDEDRAAFTECALQARRVDTRVESRFRREDGSTLPVQLSLSAIPLQEAGDGLCLVATDLSEQKRVEKLLDAVIENIPDSVFLKDAQSLRYLMLNRGSETVLGIPREELLGKTDYEYFSEAEAAFFRAKDREALRAGKLLDIPEESVITAGKQRWLHVRKIPLFAANGRPEYLLGIGEDITERKQWEEMRSRLVAIVESSDYAIIGRSFDNTITSWNSAAERLFGFAPDEMIGKSMWLLIPKHRFEEESQILERSRNGERIESFETVRRRKDGSEVHVSLTLSIIRDASGASTGISTIARDITPMRALIQAKNAAEAVNEQTAAAKRRLEHEVVERKRAEQKLRYVAYHDTLTGLPNRALFLSALAKALRRMRRHPRRGVAVLFLDLDRFKVVNDSLGHDAGDALLVALAGRLAGCVRPYDTLARMGGDEFTILLDDIGCAGDAVALAERIIEALKRPFEVAGHVIFSSTSIGIALAGSGSDVADAMLRDADTAMYRAKQRGGGHYELFVHELHVQAMARLELETDLRRALARGELHLAYQPIVALENGRLAGFEALARWHHPQHGEIPPGVFVPLAEETGLILPLGEWVVSEACRQARIWQDVGRARSRLAVSVNVSAKQLTAHSLSGAASPAHFSTHLARALSESGLEAADLKLEITESALLEYAKETETTLAQLRALGVTVELDDFGTGYSSLSSLQQFPIDTVKIDRSFISDGSGGGIANPEIAGAIVALALTLNKRVTAEGVETFEQLAALRKLRCTSAQGHVLSRPISAAATSAFIRSYEDSSIWSALWEAPA